jgi:hypothetical protein
MTPLVKKRGRSRVSGRGDFVAQIDRDTIVSFESVLLEENIRT